MSRLHLCLVEMDFVVELEENLNMHYSIVAIKLRVCMNSVHSAQCTVHTHGGIWAIENVLCHGSWPLLVAIANNIKFGVQTHGFY